MKKLFIILIFIFVFINYYNFSLLRAEEPSKYAPSKTYEGIFGMAGPKYPLEKKLDIFERTFKGAPWINGMLVIVPWKNLQPEENRFDWQEVDKLVNLAVKYNRKVSICFASVLAPDWIYEKGVPKFFRTDINPHHQTHGQKLTVPMPLSDKFYELWSGFIKEAGKRYDTNPAVAAVVIMGVNFQGFEIYCRLNTEEEKQQAREFGITSENVLAYWRRYIDLFIQAFPNTMCTLHIAEVFQNDPTVLDRIVAYGADKYPERFQIQTDKLDGRKDQTGQHEYDLVRKYSSKISVGFQMVATFKDKQRQGSMLMTLMNGIRANAKYYELWTGDAVDPQISKSFYDLWQEGKLVGWEKLMERAKASGEYKTLQEDKYRPSWQG